MLSRVQSSLLSGIDALPCEIEVDFDDAVEVPQGNVRPVVVGLPDAAVKESVERVKSALLNSGYIFPTGRVLINLAPADVRKEGPVYDLPIAVGLLHVQGVIGHAVARRPGLPAMKTPRPLRPPQPSTVAPLAGASAADRFFGADADAAPGEVAEPMDIRALLFAGELALDGRVRPVKGVIALATLAKERGAHGVVVPAENVAEAGVVEGVEVYGVRTLTELVGLLNGAIPPPVQQRLDIRALLRDATAPVDFAEVRGQESVKRALTIAAAGSHNVLMLGPPGSGKTMMAKALPGILPPLTPEEALEITRIFSAAGQLPPGTGLVTTRPVRSPHHSASLPALVGGGVVPKPGEISLAHHGVLFLDELPEFDRDVLEALRQPLEEHCVTIARSHSAVRFPASCMLVAAMNPTPKGSVAPGETGRRAMKKYLEKLSGPLLDRIDIHVEAPAVPWEELSRGRTAGQQSHHTPGTSTAQMRQSVLRARRACAQRGQTRPNAFLSGKALDACAVMEPAAADLLGRAIRELGISARGYDKVRRVSRTIADIDQAATIRAEHVAEAVGYRLLDRNV